MLTQLEISKRLKAIKPELESSWEFFTLENYLEHLLGLKVDLVTRNSLKEQIKDSILNQVLYI